MNRRQRQSQSFWVWSVLLFLMAGAVVLGWYHRGNGQTMTQPALSSRSNLEDIRGVVNQNTALLGSMRETMTELSDQHKWLLGLLITTLVGIVAELVKHYTPRQSVQRGDDG